MTDDKASAYYQHSGKVALASRISYAVRQQIFERFMSIMQPTTHSRVLDIGVTSDTTYRESNFLEKLYPHTSQLVCIGTEDGSHLENEYPGLTFMRVESGKPLPFTDAEFDFAFSNAVIEHVGNAEQQAAFVQEACRVARRVFITTPNRWFPVEHHTAVPLLHYLPKPIYRRIIAHSPLHYWSHERHLNSLTFSSFKKCFASTYPITIEYSGVGWAFARSNLIAYTATDK